MTKLQRHSEQRPVTSTLCARDLEAVRGRRAGRATARGRTRRARPRGGSCSQTRWWWWPLAAQPVHAPRRDGGRAHRRRRLAERRERPVDRREPDARPAGAQAVVELLRRRAVRLAGELGEHREPLRASAAARGPRAVGVPVALSPSRAYDSRSLRTKIVLISSAAAAAAGCGRPRRARPGTQVVAVLLSARLRRRADRRRARRGENLTPPGAEPHDLEVSPSDVAATSRAADLVLLLGHGFQPQLEDAAGRRATRVLARSTRPASPGCRRRPARLARPAPLRADRRADRRGAPPARGRAALVARLARSTATTAAGSHAARAATIVTSHAAFAYLAAALRAPAGRGHRPRARVGADAARLERRRRRRSADAARDDGLLRAARLAADRRDGRARDRRADRGPRPDRGADEDAARAATTTSRSCAPTSPRCGRRSDAASRRARATSRSPTAAGRPCSRDVDLAVEPGEFVAIAGPNGGGKTTLLRVALGLERPTHGDGAALRRAGAAARGAAASATSPQRARLGIAAPVTVREVVAAGRVAARGLLGPLRRADRAHVDEAIARVGLDRAARDAPLASALRRPAAARLHRQGARGRAASCSSLDEPTAGVDADAQESLAALLDELHRDLGVTILFVSHEFGAVERFVDRLVLVRGGIVFDGAAGAPCPRPGTTPRTSMLDARVHAARVRRRRDRRAARAGGRLLPRPAAAEPDRRRHRPRRLRRRRRRLPARRLAGR